MAVSIVNEIPAFSFSADLRSVVFETDTYLEKENHAVRIRLYIARLPTDTLHLEMEEIYDARLPVRRGRFKAWSADPIPQALYFGTAEGVLGDKLHDHICADLHLNGLDVPPSGGMAQCMVSCRRFMFSYAESWGEDEIEEGPEINSPTYTVINGGLSFLAQSRTTLEALINPATAMYDRFLTQAPVKESARMDQPQYLYFFNARPTATVELRVKLYQEGLSPSEHVLHSFECTEMSKYAFDLSPEILPLAPEATLIRYEVWLQSGSARRSEVRTFVVDHRPLDFARCFLNWSSWGAMDSRVCSGLGSGTLQVRAERVARVLTQGFDYTKGQASVFNTSLHAEYTVTTGFMDRRRLFLFRDFYLSAFKFRWLDGQLMPIELLSGSIEEMQDGNSLYAQEFQYRYRYDEHAYTEGDAVEPGTHFNGHIFDQPVEWNTLATANGTPIADNEGNEITAPQ